jgi:hypothetical protein
MGLFKRGDAYWYEFWYDGKLHRGSTGVSNERAAEEIERAYRTVLAKGEVGMMQLRPIPAFGAAMKDFLDWSSEAHKKPAYTRYKTSSVALLLFFRDTFLDEITPEEVERFAASRAVENKATVRLELACLDDLFDFVVKAGVLAENPVSTLLKSFRLELVRFLMGERISSEPIVDPGWLGSRGRMLPAMPIVIYYSSDAVAVSREVQGKDILFRFAFRRGRLSDQLGPYALREMFLRVRTPDEAIDFLGRSGYFVAFSRGEERVAKTLTWSTFRKWQDLIRYVLSGGEITMREISSGPPRSDSKPGLADHLRFVRREISSHEELHWFGQPKMLRILTQTSCKNPEDAVRRQTVRSVINTGCTLETILATVYIDGLNGINYQLCSLRGCQEPYEVISKHERKYCSPDCAHKASIRRRLAEKKSPEQETKNEVVTSKSKRRN